MNEMSPSVQQWPIAAAMLQFPNRLADGTLTRDADASEWFDTFAQIGRTGFDLVEINDSWMHIDELSGTRLRELSAAAAEAGVSLPSLCIVRSSIIDPDDGTDNLAYTHRSIDAASQLGMNTVSIGFHRPLTAEQKRQLWFWTAQGATDNPDDFPNWHTAVSRVRELGEHAASLGMELTLEMYEDTYLGSAESAVRFVTEVDLDTVGLNPDIGNFIRLHRPIGDWMQTLRATLPFANYWHVKNYHRDEDPASGAVTTLPAPLRYGLIDYRTAVRDALSFGFKGMFVCEHYGGDGLGVSAENREYLRTLLPLEQYPQSVVIESEASR